MMRTISGKYTGPTEKPPRKRRLRLTSATVNRMIRDAFPKQKACHIECLKACASDSVGECNRICRRLCK